MYCELYLKIKIYIVILTVGCIYFITNQTIKPIDYRYIFFCMHSYIKSLSYYIKDGTILNKHFKTLVLGVIDQEIHMLFKDSDGKEELLEGALVGLRVKNNNNIMDSQFNGQFCHWIFTADGYIQPTGMSA